MFLSGLGMWNFMPPDVSLNFRFRFLYISRFLKPQIAPSIQALGSLYHIQTSIYLYLAYWLA